MTTITLGLITNNDANSMGDTLAQLAPFVDEIIIVDSYSKDDTVAIASHYGARIYECDRGDSIATMKNFAIDKATSQYILFMYSGELVADPTYLFGIDFESDIYSILKREGTDITYIVKTNSLTRFENDTILGIEDTVLLNTCII